MPECPNAPMPQSRNTSLPDPLIAPLQVGGRGFQDVTSQLLTHPHLRVLRLEEVDLDSGAVGAVADLVRDGAPLTRLELRRCMIPPRAIARFARALRSNRRLITLVFCDNGECVYVYVGAGWWGHGRPLP